MSNSRYDLQNQIQATETTLNLLEAVSSDSNFSQRGLSERLGIALGLTNAVLKRCVKKGLLKIRQAPARRFAYYLTPKGFAEKSKLTAEYLNHSLQFYGTARREFDELITYCHTRGWTRVVIAGATELAEISTLAAIGTDVRLIGVLDPGRNEASFCNLPVLRTLEELSHDQRPHAVILTDTQDPQSAFDRLSQIMPHDRILAPKFLHILHHSEDALSTEGAE